MTKQYRVRAAPREAKDDTEKSEGQEDGFLEHCFPVVVLAVRKASRRGLHVTGGAAEQAPPRQNLLRQVTVK